MKTPQQSYPTLTKALGVPEVWLKREDQHNMGSHKGRSIPLMIKEYAKQGARNFVISSSGNAALAAIHAIQTHNQSNRHDPLALTVFVGRNIDKEKLWILQAALNDKNVSLQQTNEPKKEAFQIDKSGQAKSLRQSTDDLALEGYFELAQELNKIENLQAIFIPTSSGTTAQALGEAFMKFNQHPQIHIVQTTACHPIAEEFDRPSLHPPFPSTPLGTGSREGQNTLSPPLEGGVSRPQSGRGGLASAIVDHIAHRKAKVIEVIKNSGGSGWIVTDEEIQEAMKLVEETCEIAISPNSALSVAGLKKASQNGWQWTGPVVCLITGR